MTRVVIQRYIKMVLVFFTAVLPVCASAQGRTTLSRAALDSLVNPALSTTAEGVLHSDMECIDIGTIEGGGRHEVCFTIRNISDEEVIIDRLRSSCSCLSIGTTPQHLDSGNSLDIEATLNTAGRSGRFSHNILIYTSKDKMLPTLRMRIEGEIINNDTWLHLPVEMGCLRLSRNSLVLDNIRVGARRSERIACANSGEHTLHISATSTIEGLTLRCEPEMLMPGAEGDIVVSYEPTVELPVPELRTALIVEGVEASPTQRMINITIRR